VATALPKASAVGDTVQFQAVSLTRLIDSPVLSGRYLNTVPLGGQPSTFVHFAADSAAALNAPEATLAHLRKLVGEASTLFGATHYGEYHFLWTLSDLIDYEGIEHHESSDNRTAERALIDDDMRHSWAVNTLLPHEFVHSWNGKYRRPVGLATGNYDAPMRGDLLWVYEGLTEYLGMVLSARSGLATPEEFRVDGIAQRPGMAPTLGYRGSRTIGLRTAVRLEGPHAGHRFLSRVGAFVARSGHADPQQVQRWEKSG
jgi:predicted metalloprotease with PDZ domain